MGKFSCCPCGLFFVKLVVLVRSRRQAHNPTLAKILRLTYNRSRSHNRPQTAACNAVYSISRRALLITRLGEQLPRPRQVSMKCRWGFVCVNIKEMFLQMMGVNYFDKGSRSYQQHSANVCNTEVTCAGAR